MLLYAYTGKFVGKPVVRCAKSKEYDRNTGKRCCFYQQPFWGSLSNLPKSVLGQMRTLRSNLRWGLLHGYQTRG